MESEKVKEIKNALECMSGLCKDSLSSICFECEIDKKYDEESACKEALTLINELEREKKEHGKKKFLRGWKLGIEEIAERLREKLKARHEVNRLLPMPVRDVVLSTIEGLFEDVDETLRELVEL